jgi:nucleotide-binding universal stress UspA family protein
LEKTMQSILLVTDLSDAALPALQRAAQLAAQQRAGLIVLTAADDGPANPWRDALRAPGATSLALQRARRMLNRLAREVRGRCELRMMAEGRESDAILQIRRAAEEADLVVLGGGRGNPLRAMLLGTPAERIVRVSRRPVLVVKRVPPAASAPYRRVLVPVDLAEAVVDRAMPAIGLAARVAPDASLHLLHAVSMPMESRLRLSGCSEEQLRSQRQRAQATALHRLWSLAAMLPRQRVFASVGEGPPSSLTLRKSLEVSADLIVVGKEGRSAIGDFLLGSTARHLLADADADVLVLPREALGPALGKAVGQTAGRGAVAAGKAPVAAVGASEVVSGFAAQNVHCKHIAMRTEQGKARGRQRPISSAR